MGMKVHAACSVIMNGAVGAAGTRFVFNDGAFDATLTWTATGNMAVTLEDGYAIDASECVVVVTHRGTLAASQLTTFGVTHTSDTVKTITCLREGAAGAVSALFDGDFDLVIYKRELI